MDTSASVDTYINRFSGEAKDRLIRIREIISFTAPEAEEGIMYGLIGYKLKKKPLVYFGAFAQHIGFYATPQGHAEFEAELSDYQQGRGSVRFPLNQPLPTDLITRMVKRRKEMVENA